MLTPEEWVPTGWRLPPRTDQCFSSRDRASLDPVARCAVILGYAAGCFLLEASFRWTITSRNKALKALGGVPSSRLTSIASSIVIGALASIYLVVESTCTSSGLHPGLSPILSTLGLDGQRLGQLPELVLLLMLGYILTDTYLDVRNGELDGKMFLHHAMGIVSDTLALVAYAPPARIAMLVHIAELSNPSLHFSKLLMDTGLNKTFPRLYTLVGASFVLLFFLLRVVSPGFIVASLLTRRTREGFRGEWADAHHMTITVISAVWWLINLVWFRLILRLAAAKPKAAEQKSA
jgi:hypothetical protein